ncbi:MAG: hypothetical protein H6Q20_1935 [Bacteroidetes bacterium]|nr:hypothetical protein [Bacteroidota bacterium]
MHISNLLIIKLTQQFFIRFKSLCCNCTIYFSGIVAVFILPFKASSALWIKLLKS